ncbi:DNA adenine methylase [Pyrinomonas methylaliphatogenes]|uniref:Site-specific DNA methylase n=1 Tax=Pyrinomonas methylaliphatogenes TaxID=454194 RepID=A0A0B6WVC2_9BACT|nr:DNA adenine methylase [Pyrinomonas methylaliphatogenes]CDM64712.1 site-specific DNA methylase [Pyrinomonas methylaliphatogenes]
MAKVRQLPLFADVYGQAETPKPVNVASVPQRSPFRYPGGKTWFVPTFRCWMASLKNRPRILVEPFAGGGTISLTALFENLVERAVMVELDDEIAAVWETVVNGDAEWLANRILTFEMTREAVLEELQKTPTTTREKAFQTILKNRTLHGGILAEGSRFIKYGENGKGIGSRWYPKTLANRLLNLNAVVNRIDFRCDDGLKVMAEFSRSEEAVFFIDPPYTAGGKKAGKRLYRHHQIDHEYLFTLCESLAGHFLMTYDEAEEVKEMARRHGFHMRLIPMKNTHHATMREIVISRDLSWLDALTHRA